MYPLSIPEIFFNIFLFLDLKDIIIFSITSKEIYKLYIEYNKIQKEYISDEYQY